ncbi:MAG: hypothetical protein ACAH11_14995 [Sphingomonas sp.]
MVLLFAALILYFVGLIGSCVFALFKGGRTERVAVGIIVAAALLSQVASLMGNRWRGFEAYVMAVDAVAFIAFVILAKNSRKFWPIWAAAAQLIGTLTHLVVLFEPSVVLEVYASTQPFWALPVIVAMAVGTRGEMRRSPV